MTETESYRVLWHWECDVRVAVLSDGTTARASSAIGLGEKVQQPPARAGRTSQLRSVYTGGCSGRGIWKAQAPLNERPLSGVPEHPWSSSLVNRSLIENQWVIALGHQLMRPTIRCYTVM
jgi:hypothetical protein